VIWISACNPSTPVPLAIEQKVAQASGAPAGGTLLPARGCGSSSRQSAHRGKAVSLRARQARIFEVPTRQSSGEDEADLFQVGPALPSGFEYGAEFIEPQTERTLLADLKGLPFKHFEFHGFQGKRRVVSFGWRYDFNGGGLTKTEEMPPFLLAVRQRAAAFARVSSERLQQVLVTEYQPGAAIGWHKDRSVFGDVIGISLLSVCTFRFRRKKGASWERANLNLGPRSIYLLRGPSRAEWEHSIPAVASMRYSITFREILRRAER
jgi:alkylated DNA repair dioxygenase AlkB